MAPELLVKDLRLREASLTDMINADIWAYGMVVFNIINPGLKHPYEKNLENCCAGDAPAVTCVAKVCQRKRNACGAT